MSADDRREELRGSEVRSQFGAGRERSAVGIAACHRRRRRPSLCLGSQQSGSITMRKPRQSRSLLPQQLQLVGIRPADRTPVTGRDNSHVT